MREFSYDTAHLKKYRNAALQFTNRIREELGQPPLEALLPGSISEATSCVVTKSIEAPGLYGNTGYDAVRIYDVTLPVDGNYCLSNEHRAKGDEFIYLRNDEVDEFDHAESDHILPKKMVKVPADVQRFLKAFDDGWYEDLVLESQFEEV